MTRDKFEHDGVTYEFTGAIRIPHLGEPYINKYGQVRVFDPDSMVVTTGRPILRKIPQRWVIDGITFEETGEARRLHPHEWGYHPHAKNLVRLESGSVGIYYPVRIVRS